MLRRRFLRSAASFTLLTGLGLPRAMASSPDAVQARLRDVEAACKGRLGVHILDTATGQEYGYRSDERCMLLSSFKILASALVLNRVDRGLESLERRIPYTSKDLVVWSPVTERHADGPGLTLAQLCEATITTSDNTAANLILASFGGPGALTAYLRKLGDTVTRLDRIEPELNFWHADGISDTTTPRAMLNTMRKLLMEDALSRQSRELLQQWMLANTTGGKRLKAGLPAGWRIGDKTGSSEIDVNDVGIIWPPQRAPLLVTAYLTGSRAGTEAKNAAIAEVGRLACELAG